MSADTPDLAPCPFCGAGQTVIHVNRGTWTGMGWSEPVSVEVRHWCAEVPGQPSRLIARVGRDEKAAIAAWNRRAPAPAPPSDWDLRGMLAARLSCWHRLTGSESDELVALARSWGAPAASGEPVAWLIQLSPATLGGQELTTLRDRAKLARHLGYSVTNLYAKPAQS